MTISFEPSSWQLMLYRPSEWSTDLVAPPLNQMIEESRSSWKPPHSSGLIIDRSSAITVFDLISERTLISGYPPILCRRRLFPEHLEIYVYWLCYCVASCNRYLMLINHPTDGATRGPTLRVRLIGQNLKKR